MRVALFFLLALVVFVPVARADSLVNVTNAGNVVVNVLSAQDIADLAIPQSEYLKVKSAVSTAPATAKIALTRDGDKTLLTLENGESLDVSSFKSGLVEIEERSKQKHFDISTNSDGFVLTQDGLSVTTNYDIAIDPASARVSLTTPSGAKYLAIFPREALDTTLRSKVITKVSSEGSMALSDRADQGLVYKINGEKVLNFFNLYKHPVSVSADVSATTAQIVSVDQPPWLYVLSYLFG